jgi:hypothetical protein
MLDGEIEEDFVVVEFDIPLFRLRHAELVGNERLRQAHPLARLSNPTSRRRPLRLAHTPWSRQGGKGSLGQRTLISFHRIPSLPMILQFRAYDARAPIPDRASPRVSSQ